MPGQPIPQVPRPPDSPLIQPIAQEQQEQQSLGLLDFNHQPVAQQQRQPVVQNQIRQQVAQYPEPAQVAYQKIVEQPPQQLLQQAQYPDLQINKSYRIDTTKNLPPNNRYS